MACAMLSTLVCVELTRNAYQAFKRASFVFALFDYNIHIAKGHISKMLRLKFFLFCLILVLISTEFPVYSQDISVIPIAHNLNNPRGLAVMPDGRLLVVEAGTGRDRPLEVEGSGQISILDDLNADGDYDDEGERNPILTGQASYNSLPLFETFHDEIFGLSDIVLFDNGRIFFTKDEPFAERAPNMPDDMELYEGDTGIYELRDSQAWQLVERGATINALAFDPERELFYAVESGYNQLMSVDLDGEAKALIAFPILAHIQQPVPAGITYDAQTGDILIALFSGFVHNYFGTDLSYMPHDAKIMRFNPDTGILSDEIIGLTTAIDVAVDEQGNIFVVELTTQWPPALMPIEFDLYNPDAPPDPGGYARFSGRVSMYPADGTEAIILADGLDTPTNITYADGRLYVSTGLGTPERRVLTPEGIYLIEGVIYLITGF